MAMTHLSLKITNPADIKKATELQFLVDSGALYSVVPSKVLKKLEIKPLEEREFILANGQKISRKLGGVLYSYQGQKGHAPVIFGQKGDSTLLGATALEALGLALNPLKRELMPLPMVLG